MSKVTIQSASTGARLEFSDLGNEYFTVSYSSPSLTACHRVWLYTGDAERLLSLFGDMAKNWTGWEGEKTWTAIEGDFSLACTSDQLGHITLSVELIDRDHPEGWSANFHVGVEAGQLENLARAMKSLLQGV